MVGTKLVNTFKADLRTAVAQAQSQCPEVTLTILNPDVEPDPTLSHVPRYFGPTLPAGARIHSCDQNPWETVHILASGSVVVCEVHDETSLGNLYEQTLSQIWHGENYRRFRERYNAGSIPQCRECPWKTAYLPPAWKSMIHAADGMNAQLLRGWYSEEGGNILWSKRESLAVLKNLPGGKRVRVTGILPHSPKTGRNVLQVECNGVRLGHVTNESKAFLSFDSYFDLDRSAANLLHLRFTTADLFRPSSQSVSGDTRDLGFALCRLEALKR